MFQHLRLRGALYISDLETTGTDPVQDRIVEVAVPRLAPRKVPVSLVRLVNLGVPITPAATTVHGLTDDDVSDRPTFWASARRLARLLHGCDLADFGLRRCTRWRAERDKRREGSRL